MRTLIIEMNSPKYVWIVDNKNTDVIYKSADHVLTMNEIANYIRRDPDLGLIIINKDYCTEVMDNEKVSKIRAAIEEEDKKNE